MILSASVQAGQMGREAGPAGAARRWLADVILMSCLMCDRSFEQI